MSQQNPFAKISFEMWIDFQATASATAPLLCSQVICWKSKIDSQIRLKFMILDILLDLPMLPRRCPVEINHDATASQYCPRDLREAVKGWHGDRGNRTAQKLQVAVFTFKPYFFLQFNRQCWARSAPLWYWPHLSWWWSILEKWLTPVLITRWTELILA